MEAWCTMVLHRAWKGTEHHLQSTEQNTLEKLDLFNLKFNWGPI